jgi:subtilisin family serine protease
LARIRYLGDIPQKVVSKVFDILPATTRCEYPCKSPTDPAIRTVGDDCNFKYECRKRIETYDVDTSMQEVRAGVPFVFAKGRLLFESKRKDRMVRMRILALTDPTFHRRTAATFNGTQGGGQLKLSSNLPRSTINGKTIIIVKNMNITQRLEGNSDAFYCASWRQGCITEKPTEIEVVINESYIPDLLDGLTYTASTDSGTNMTNRQRMIRIQIQFLQQSMKPWPSIMPLDTGYEGGRDAETGMCKPGFASKFLPRACDTIFPPFELRMVVEPVDRGQRVVRPKNGEGSGGRKTVLSRDGHGTHVVTSIVGNALENVPANTPDPTTWQEYVNVVSQALDKTSTVIRKFNGLATGAQMSFFDIGKSGNVYLTPPESLGDALFGRPYREGRARIFLNPWTCEDYVWWRKQDQDFSIEQEVAFSSALNTNSSICNRYGSDAWEVDDFVARYPDLLVIFPSGDNGAGGINTVSSPGTCKNCLTVGTSFSWPESLETSIDFELNQCQDIDCPQDVDKTETCADPKRASPFLVPACCRKKYKSGAYAPGDVDPRSSRGHAVNKQAPFNVFGGKTYSDLTALEFQRFKPEVVAPGVNIVSGRSDGDTESLGTNPKLGNNDDVLVQPERCRLDNRKLDRACLSTMSGSSMAAAKVTAIAALVHQYFADGYHPGGKKGFATFPFDPSAALVKSVILASADQMYRSLSLNASITDIATLPVPNFYYGFGRPRLMNVLTVDTGEELTLHNYNPVLDVSMHNDTKSTLN